jgi:hypothetical protein
VKSSLATVDCSDKSRSKQESLDEVTMALYITADEINVMERWGKAAKDRRKWEVKMMRVPEVDKIQMLAYVTDHKLVSLLATAANISFAERALQREHIRFLRKVNNEAKVRRNQVYSAREGKGDELRGPRRGTSEACWERTSHCKQWKTWS